MDSRNMPPYDLFTGTAEYYARYRPRYTGALLMTSAR